jgi:hypothetical protein
MELGLGARQNILADERNRPIFERFDRMRPIGQMKRQHSILPRVILILKLAFKKKQREISSKRNRIENEPLKGYLSGGRNNFGVDKHIVVELAL